MRATTLQSALVTCLQATGYPVWAEEAVSAGIKLPYLSFTTQREEDILHITITLWTSDGLSALFEAVDRLLNALPATGRLIALPDGLLWLWSRRWQYLRDEEEREWTGLRWEVEGRIYDGR